LTYLLTYLVTSDLCQGQNGENVTVTTVVNWPCRRMHSTTHAVWLLHCILWRHLPHENVMSAE